MCYFQAIDLTKKLRRFQLKDFAHQNQVIINNMKTNSVPIDFEKYRQVRQVNVLIMEISNSLPRITAAGFFDVDLQLIPTVLLYNIQ